ncbi:calcium-binding protein, partial [Cribrihabitans sp. XS_ASV171]
GDDYIHGGSDGSLNDTGSWEFSVPDGSMPLLDQGWTINLRANSATFSAGIALASETDAVFEIEHVIGSGYDDTITGNDASNRLEGDLGNDTLIDDSSGPDTLIGGQGTDTAIFTGFFSSGTVFDMVQGHRSYNGTVIDEFSQIENLVFDGNVTVIGDGEDNHLSASLPDAARDSSISGGSGDDTIDAGAGNDTVLGGNGDDLIIDRLEIGSNSTLSGNGNTDTLDLSGAGTGFTYVAGGPLSGNNGVELDVSGFEHIIGSAFADRIEELPGLD